ncbi:(2Fe-2S)-binding protein [Singulisphaera sp. PoT]|uniref:(2Fe-2S)-binding protein n=1 Tax=Singulisphaera sp. PoT TaxID=3411797 RepID=UPI003BF4F1B3
MPESTTIRLTLDGRPIEVPNGTMVAAALAIAEIPASRRSVSGEPRGPVCGMGICFECRVTIDGVPHRLGCLTPCAPGMEVRTDAP